MVAQNKVMVKPGHHAIILLIIKDCCNEPAAGFEATKIQSGLLFSRALFQAGPTGVFWVRAMNVTDQEVQLVRHQTAGKTSNIDVQYSWCLKAWHLLVERERKMIPSCFLQLRGTQTSAGVTKQLDGRNYQHNEQNYLRSTFIPFGFATVQISTIFFWC